MLDLTNAINQATFDSEPRSHLGASIIGDDCFRKIWYSYHHPELQQISPRLQRIFQVGHVIEGLVIDGLKQTFHVEHGVKLCNTRVPQFQGTPDCILTYRKRRYVIDIKTANNSSFNQFVKMGLRGWRPTYYAQLQAYMGMGDFAPKAAVVAINKDNSEIHHEWIGFDCIEYDLLVQKARRVIEIDAVPDRIRDDPTYFKCKMCQFHKECHGLKDT